MVTAKGLAGGYAPLGAALMTEEVYRTIADTFGTIASVHTYSGHTAACAAGLAVQKVIIRDGLVAKCRTDGTYLMQALGQAFGQNPHVGDIRGRGFFVAVELVRIATPRPPSRRPTASTSASRTRPSPAACSATLARHGRRLCGRPRHPRPALHHHPPEIDQMVDLLKDAVDAALLSLPKDAA